MERDEMTIKTGYRTEYGEGCYYSLISVARGPIEESDEFVHFRNVRRSSRFAHECWILQTVKKSGQSQHLSAKYFDVQ